MATGTNATTPLTPFEPDYSAAPGDLLSEVLEDTGMTQTDLARRLGVTLKHVNQVVQGEATLSNALALGLERVTGVSAGLWNGMEANYRDHLARIAEEETLAADTDWLGELPLRAMIRRGLVADHGRDRVAQLRSVLGFFGVASRRSFDDVCAEASYRKARAFAANPTHVAVWLRAGELAAARIDTEPFDKTAFRTELDGIRELTTVRTPDDFFDELVERCRRCGVAVVVVPEIGKTRASGATRWLGPHRALIQLSNRGKWAEAFWFTFFHEAAHVLLHPKKRTFIDADAVQDAGAVDADEAKWETEADRFALDHLIPRDRVDRLATLRTKADIAAFAEQIGVGTGIVAGRLHKEGMIPANRFNKADIHPRYDFDAANEPQDR